MDEKYELSPETAKQFTLAPGAPPLFYRPQFGQIDIRTLTPEKAQALIKAGCKHLVPVETPAKAIKPPTPAV